MHAPRLALVALALSACVGPTDRIAAPARATHGRVVHEWGTYTSLQSSDGRSMDGLHHAENLLPPFVYARAPNAPGVKGIDNLPEPVNQKLETPVLYFYGGRPERVTVDVRFPQGIISEWYPDAAAIAPPIGEMSRMGEGEARWDVDLVDPDGAGFAPPEVPAGSIWAPARRVAALGVRTRDRGATEDERFIFYRGLARFERPLRITSGDDRVTLHNGSDDAIPAAFVLEVTGGGGAITAAGALAPRSDREAAIPRALDPIDAYVARAKDLVAAALIEGGLFPDEARAMVDTWEQSYFTAPGTRVLYLAPRAWTDELLPITIDPAPVELVRTLVGRIEVLTPAEERAIVTRVEAAARGEAELSVDTYGRFTEPRLRRALELIEDAETRGWCRADGRQRRVPAVSRPSDRLRMLARIRGSRLPW